MTNVNQFIPKVWLDKNKKKISCKEKIKLMKTNLYEFHDLLKDIVDEAVLIGVDEDQIKNILLDIVKNTKNDLNNV